MLHQMLQHAKEYRAIQTACQEKTSPLYVYGLGDSASGWLAEALRQALNRQVLLVTSSEAQAQRLHQLLSNFCEDWLLFPSHVPAFFEVFTDSHVLAMARTRVLNRLRTAEPCGIVASVEALMSCVQPPELRMPSLCLERGMILEPGALQLILLTMGYETVDLVESPGQMNMRGGILDVYPIQSENPLRMEFFGDEIDSLRFYDPTNQLSIENLKIAEVAPCREWTLNSDEATGYAVLLRDCARRPGLSEVLKESLLETAQHLEARMLAIPAIERFAPVFWASAGLLDYFTQEALTLWVDPLRLGERAEAWYADFEQRYVSHFEAGQVLEEQYKLAQSWESLRMHLGDRMVVVTDLLQKDPRYFKPAQMIAFTQMEPPKYFGKLDALATDLNVWRERGYKIALMMGEARVAEGLRDGLAEYGVPVTIAREGNHVILPGQVMVSELDFPEGLSFTTSKIMVLTRQDIFNTLHRSRPKKREGKERVIRSFNTLAEGDLVVHEAHGIGRYMGVEQLKVDQHYRDYLKIKYAGDDKLYIPVEQMELLQKYIGGGESQTKLSKLGGAEWGRAKQKVRRAIEDMTEELVQLYAGRMKLPGFAFSPDSEWQRQFESTFPYTETPDQLRCIEEIKVDMEQARPMERLLCGDVGYGKTEVALRAIFKAVMDSKQVVMLVPTTILAQQHYNTLAERFSKFPVKIAMMSRFQSKKQCADAAEGLRGGWIDVVVGTHRVLSEDVGFKNLGLLVIDEEQRFGVKHKERIKALKTNVDILTLTATPIPRTLHLSLSGIRDMSLLEDPPEDRYPIQTYVAAYREGVIHEAIMRETAREGQVYFVHNRIQDMDRVTARLQALLPGLDIRYAHGQMPEGKLEKVMLAFLNRAFDVLVCTTIIETGLDLPNVNTIIINDADKMGLAQLYQLRGRVGRSNRVAYSYLLYQKDKILTEISEKRLKAIKEFTDLGAGFRIAMRDLELRGTGNLLGAEQHGHMSTIGYELYCQLLEESMIRIKGVPVAENVETLIEFAIDAFIPDSYVPVATHKLELYRRISAIRHEADRQRMTDELLDRYGDLPESVTNLLNVAYARALAGRLKLLSLVEEPSAVLGRFHHEAPVTPEAILALCADYGKAFQFIGQPKPHFRLHFSGGKLDQKSKLNQTVMFLRTFVGFIEGESRL